MLEQHHPHCFLCIVLWISVAFLSSATGGAAIKGPPRISNRENRASLQVVRLGQEFRVTCPIEGEPNPMIDWLKDGESITPAWPRFRLNNKGLRIRPVAFDDAGVYQCKGVNGFGSQVSRMRLVVADPNPSQSENGGDEPETSVRKRQDSSSGSNKSKSSSSSSSSSSIPVFTQETLEQAGPMHLSAGNTIRFRCETKDYPAKVIWLKDGKPVGDKRASWTLVLNKLVASDTGNYTCVNVASNESVNIQLLVTELVEEQKPELAWGYTNNTSVLSGHEAVLECVVQSGHTVMPPHIKWLKRLPKDQPPPVLPTGKHNHKLLSVENQHLLVIQETEDDSIRINETQRNGTFVSKLIFARTEPDDDAVYVCLVTNNFGYNFKEARLTVLVGAEIMSSSSSLIPFPLIVIGMSLIVAVVVIAAACSLRRHQDHHLPKQQTKSMSPRQLSNPSINYYKGFEQRQLLVSTSTHSSSTSSGGGGGGGSGGGGSGGGNMICQTKLVSSSSSKPGVAMSISRCSCCAQQQQEQEQLHHHHHHQQQQQQQQHKNNQEISALQTYDQCFNNSYVGSSTSHSLHCGHWT